MANPVTKVNLDIYDDSTYQHKFNVVDGSGNAVDLTGYTAKLLMKETETSAILFTALVTDYLTVDASGYVMLDIPGSVVGGWNFDEAKYDLAVIDGTSKPFVVSRGNVRIYPSVYE